MATPTKAQIKDVRNAGIKLELVIQQYYQSGRQYADLTIAEQKAYVTAMKTAVDALNTQLNA
jgi:hypothetical protein